MSASLLLTLVFAAALMLGLLLKFWLASRQVRHVARHRNAVPEVFAQTVTLAAHQRAADYTLAKARVGMLEMAWSAAVLLGWTLLGGLDALNQALLGWIGGGLWQELALVACFTMIGALLDLPFTLWQTFGVEQRFGFNKMTRGLWLADTLKSMVLTALIGLPIAALILWLMGAAGQWWWLWAWTAWVAFSLLLMAIYPAFIAPLFNKFTPLENQALKERVDALMERCGFSAKGLFVMDGSRRSAHANAYFTGFGAHKRVVFFDTLLNQLNADEIEAVLAHELGHFRLRHTIKRMVMMFALSLAGFALLGWLSNQIWFYAGLGVQPNVTAPNAALALLLFMLAVPVFMLFVAPLPALLSRKQEFEADAYAAAHANAHDLRSALLKLFQDNASTLTPDPLFVRFYYSHPPANERLARLDQAHAT